MPEFVAILDFGSQYTQLIARRVREHRVYCEILKCDTSCEELSRHQLKGIILSGGPSGVYEEEAPRCDPGIFDLNVPVLGICYGMQLGCELLGGKVVAANHREYGATEIEVNTEDPLFNEVSSLTTVWMSHGDRVTEIEEGFETTAKTENCPHAGIWHRESNFRGIQFHPEVTHTPEGSRILQNFLYPICGCSGDWSLSRFIDEKTEELRETIGSRNVVLGLSGGVDSSVVALLLDRAIGNQLTCIFVDNGVLRKNEREQVKTMFTDNYDFNLRVVDATDLFLERLAGIFDPEEKRKRIGNTFIDVFKDEAAGIDDVEFLAQGTLYPDVIESLSPIGGPSATIKSHHNVGGLPEKLGFKLVEPLRSLFKDEVRLIGKELGLAPELLERQPFPGPGLAVRVLGEVNAENLDVLRNADAIIQEEIEKWEDYPSIWQSFGVLLPVQTVGVMGDQRTYDNVVALRVVESLDGMTANWIHLPQNILGTISSRICNEVHGVNRVVLDISSKPPSTIEWE